MFIASRTPEGEPNRCTFCGRRSEMEPSITAWDAPCPHCGWLMWYEPRDDGSPTRASLFHDWVHRFRELQATNRLRFNLPRTLLDCVQETTDAVAAVVWYVQGDDVRHVQWDCIPASCLWEENRKSHHEALRAAASHPQPSFLWPVKVGKSINGNPTDYLAVLQRFRRETDVLVLELFFKPQISRGERAFLQTLLTTIDEVISAPGPVKEPGIDLAPASSVDPPIRLPAVNRLPPSWWSRLVSILRRPVEKANV